LQDFCLFGIKQNRILIGIILLTNKSGGGPPQSKTLARGMVDVATNTERFGLRQSAGALALPSLRPIVFERYDSKDY
jgi:hypothetical protein